MPLHGLGVAAWQHETGPDAPGRTDCAEEIGRFGALVLRRGGSGAAPCPAPRELGLLPDPGFILWDGSPPPRRIVFPPQTKEVQNEYQADP